jgi:hypothetical protein
MPYIKREERLPIDELIEPLAERCTSIGSINYAITRLVMRKLGPEPKYSTYALHIGNLVLCALELWARRVQPYEQEKCKTNGDVY